MKQMPVRLQLISKVTRKRLNMLIRCIIMIQVGIIYHQIGQVMHADKQPWVIIGLTVRTRKISPQIMKNDTATDFA